MGALSGSGGRVLVQWPRSCANTRGWRLILKVDHCRLNFIIRPMFLTLPAINNECPNLGRPTCFQALRSMVPTTHAMRPHVEPRGTRQTVNLSISCNVGEKQFASIEILTHFQFVDSDGKTTCPYVTHIRMWLMALIVHELMTVMPLTFLQARIRLFRWSTDSSEFVFCDKPMFFERQSDSCVNWTHPCLIQLIVYDATGFYNVPGYCFLILKISVVALRCQKSGGTKTFLLASLAGCALHFQKRGAALAVVAYYCKAPLCR